MGSAQQGVGPVPVRVLGGTKGSTLTNVYPAGSVKVAAIVEDDTKRAGFLLERAQPESPDGSVPEVSSCIGLALGLLDNWLTGTDSHAPATLAQVIRLPAGHWFGQRAAVNVLALARKGRAFQSLGSLITRQGSPQLLAGSSLALAAAVLAWSRTEGIPVGKLLLAVIR